MRRFVESISEEIERVNAKVVGNDFEFATDL